jgi:hypothetical protein
LTLAGGSCQANQGTIEFAGQGEKNLALSAPVQFSSLAVDPGVTLVESNPANTAAIAQTLANLGTIRKTLPVQGVGETSFGLTGARISVHSAVEMSGLQIEQVGQKHAQAGKLSAGSPALPLFYRLQASGGKGSADLCLSYSQAQFAAAAAGNESSLRLCQWDATQWVCYPRAKESDPAENTVCAQEVPLSSDWILAGPAGQAQNSYFLPVLAHP